jgi:hypothetical protein
MKKTRFRRHALIGAGPFTISQARRIWTEAENLGRDPIFRRLGIERVEHWCEGLEAVGNFAYVIVRASGGPMSRTTVMTVSPTGRTRLYSTTGGLDETNFDPMS